MSLFFPQLFDWSKNKIWPSKNFFGWFLCPATVQKIFWAQATQGESCVFLHKTPEKTLTSPSRN